MTHPSPHQESAWRRPLVIASWVAGAIGAYGLLTSHFEHFLGALPYVILLACPLMHVFMHQGHRRGRGAGNDHRRDPA